MITSQCFNCVYLFEKLKKLSCAAFPKGIPEEIVTGMYDHTKPYLGDNGIRFKPIKETK